MTNGFNKTFNHIVFALTWAEWNTTIYVLLFFSDSTNPSYLKLEETKFPYYFFDGDANDPNVQAAIKTNYIDFMTKSNLVPPFFCSFKSTECNEGTVEVYAGSCE